MKNINQTLAKAHSECTHTGLRLTDKRSKVLKTLLQADQPLSAYDIIERYKVSFSEPLSAMSVYRMLEFLIQSGLVHKLETTNQYLACAHIICEHAHEVPQFLICDHCHQVTEVGIPKTLLTELNISIENTGFVLRNQQLELHGLCGQCKTEK